MLEDLLVLELTDVWSGPIGGLLLSDLGARIVKIEPPEWKRPLAARMAQRDDWLFLALNRGKRSVVLDLTLPQGRKTFEGLVGKADAVLSNYPPSVVKKLGLDYTSLSRANERIICCNISGYGLQGKDLERPAYDLAIQAVSGVLSVTGEEGRAPVRAGIPLADQEAAMVAVFGILAAYIGLQKSGKGRQVDISMFDTMLLSFAHNAVDYYLSGRIPKPCGTYPTTRKRADYRAYETKDGYVVIANGRDNDKWRDVCNALGMPELGTDPRFATYDKRVTDTARVYLEEIFEPLFKTKTMDEWAKLLSAIDIPCTPVNSLDRALHDAENQGREMIVSFPAPLGGTVKGVGNPVKLGVKENLNPPPRLGEHTREVLKELLDYSDDRIAGLAKEKVIFLGS